MSSRTPGGRVPQVEYHCSIRLKGIPHAIKLDGSIESFNLQGYVINFIDVSKVSIAIEPVFVERY
jgi:hypothetical protein